MDQQENFVVEQMKKKYPEFELIGEMKAQGEEWDDQWTLVMKEGKATCVPKVFKSTKITCPACGCHFCTEEN
jgi:hypothetical protein